VKVGRSYRPGLFAGSEVAGRPRADNAPEQSFGSYRYPERRVSGKKVASPALVLRGSARVVAALAPRQQPDRDRDPAGADRAAWQSRRAELSERRQRRVERRRFRQDPHADPRQLEDLLNQSALPT
jgi:hypothetical protein